MSLNDGSGITNGSGINAGAGLWETSLLDDELELRTPQEQLARLPEPDRPTRNPEQNQRPPSDEPIEYRRTEPLVTRTRRSGGSLNVRGPANRARFHG